MADKTAGGGSNDRCIHFFHTGTGATLKTINVAAQVTSLLWSAARPEIAATLGYANPDHPIRIVVYSWPACTQVVRVPWQEDMRALYAVAYPGGPQISEGRTSSSLAAAHGGGGSGGHGVADVDADADESDDDEDIRLLRELGTRPGLRRKRRQCEGCIVVAASDETVRFHEVWGDMSASASASAGGPGGGGRGGRAGAGAGAGPGAAGGAGVGASASASGGWEVHQYRGVLGGSDILEQMEGIESEGSDVIR